MTQMTQRPTADALRAHRLACSMLAGWGPVADRLRAGGLAAAALDSMGGRAGATGQKCYGGFTKKFFIFYEKPLALSPPAYGMLTV